MAYATINDMLTRFHDRMIGDLVSDTGTRVTDFTDNAVLQAMLDDGAADINAALRQSGRYTSDQLTAIETSSDNRLRRLNCTLAMKYLWETRGNGIPSKFRDAVTDAMDGLDALRTGIHVIAINETLDHIAAGVPSTTRLTVQQRHNINGVDANVRFFPTPGERKTTG